MLKYEAVKNDLLSVRTGENRPWIFDENGELKNDVLVVDVIDWLDSIKDYEVDHDLTDEELYEKFENDRYSNLLYEDNTYNYNANVSNEIHYKVYNDEETERCYAIVRIHRYGDARYNYTDCMLFEFDTEREFFHTMCELERFVDFEIDSKEFSAEINMLSDCVNIYNHTDGEDMGEFYCVELEDLIEEVKKEMED